MTGRSRARDRSRPSGAAPAWTPARLSNLAAWFRADLGVTGSSVSAWADQSGNGRHLAQGTGSAQPTYSASDAAYGGRPVLTFDGGDYFDALASWGLSQPVTIYVVGQSGTSGDYKTFVDANAGARLIVRSTAAEMASIYGGSANVEPGASVAGPSIICAVFNAASSAVYVSDVTASATGNPGSGGLGTPRVGMGAVSVYPLPSNGKIAEVIYVNAAHDAATRAQVLSYASKRYNLSVTGL